MLGNPWGNILSGRVEETKEGGEKMRVVVSGTAKEIAALVVELQEQREREKRKKLERIVSINFTEDCMSSQKK